MSSDPKKRGLGRGLGALITDTSLGHVVDEAAAPTEEGGVRLIDVQQLSPNPHQPRTHFDEDALRELADSILAHGIIQPLVVTANPAGADLFYLVAGERRWRAARQAGLQQVPVIVREASPQQLIEWALVENIQRADLNPLEEAHAYQALMHECGYTQAQLSERVGKSRPAVANTLRLLNLPATGQQALLAGAISAGHARALLALPDAELMQSALSELIGNDLSVRQTEALVKKLVETPPTAATPEPATPEPPPETEAEALTSHFAHLVDRFRSALGTKVSLARNQDGSGKLVIHFFSDDDLGSLYERITGATE